MLSGPLAALVVATTFVVPFVASAQPETLVKRNIVDEISDEYDFVIVGGGLAGLVLGARLSQDTNHTVLVLEAGGNGDDHREQIDIPAYAYYRSLWDSALNWAFYTEPQTNLDDTVMEWPRGKVLGGSSAINGMYLVRPSEIEFDVWQDLLGDMEGADNWSWDSMYAAMKKSETFTPPSSAIAEESDITYDTADHGTDGPIHFSYPGYTFAMDGDWSVAAASAGVAQSNSTYGGQNWGAYICTSAINPSNWTRSYSRTGYLDPLPPRSNYDVLVNAHVTRIRFDSSSPADNLTADAVEFTTTNGTTTTSVKVKKEVILAGGSIGSPAVLMYSGIGPKDVLEAAGIDVVSELPGVGQNLQDHLSITMSYNTTTVTAGAIYEENNTLSTSAKFLSYVDDAVAYVNSSVLFGTNATTMQDSIISSKDYPTSSDKTVSAGYIATYKATAEKLFSSAVGQVELLIGNTDDGTITVTAALQHPYSRGRLYINSSDPMDYPVINPNYLSHDADVEILLAGLKLARTIGATSPLSSIMTETTPGLDVQSDADLIAWLRPTAYTEYHPSSSCAMLPRAQGGVVDAKLRVYGLANVRVADASVPPLEFSAHLMSSTYGLAEKASEIIRAEYDVVKVAQKKDKASGSSTSASGHKATSSGSSDAASATTTAASAGARSSVSIMTMLIAATAYMMF